MKTNQANHKDVVGGVLMLSIGAGVCWHATRYNLGSLRQMGPGFFPMSLGIILALTGLLICVSGLRTASSIPDVNWQPQWRGWFCICASLVAFVIIGNSFGLLPATFMTVLIAAFGDRKNSVWAALVLASCMTLICLVIFWWLLQMQLPLFK